MQGLEKQFSTPLLNFQENKWPLPNEITDLILELLELKDLVEFGKSTRESYQQISIFLKRKAIYYGYEKDQPLLFLKMFFKEVFTFIKKHPTEKNANLSTTTVSKKYKFFKVKVKKLDCNSSLNYLANLNVFFDLLARPDQFVKYPKITKYLIKNAKDLISNNVINLADLQQVSYLYRAAISGQSDVVEFLLDHGVEVNSQDETGSTALHFACSHNQMATIELLLIRGANINSVNNKGRSALHLACLKRHAKAAELLLKQGINENIVDQDGLTAHAALEKEIIFHL